MAYGELPPSATYAGYYRLNDDLVDASGNGRNLAMSDGSTTYAAGKFGSGSLSISTNAGGAYIASDMGYPTGGTTAVTMSAWFYPTSYPPSGGDQRVFLFRWAKQNYRVFDALWNYNGGSYQVQYRIMDPFLTLNLTYTLTLNTWTNLIYTFDGTNLTMWVNGVNRATRTAGYTYGNGTASQLVLGNGGLPSYANGFQGRIDEEIAIVGTSWSAATIKKYYTLSKGFYAPKFSI